MQEDGKILSVNDDSQTGRLERPSDGKEFEFSIPNGSSISVNPGDSVKIILAPNGQNETRAIVIDTGGDDR